jgi:hypothetical protein
MATQHKSQTEKQDKTQQHQGMEKDQSANAATSQKRKQKQDQNQRMKNDPNETPAVGEQHAANYEEGGPFGRHESREFVGEMDGPEANQGKEGHPPYSRTQGDQPEPHEVDRDRNAGDTSGGDIPVQKQRARSDVGERHK